MLEKLIVKNFALISKCEISFGEGFNVLVGETGAGKSIVIDALSFVLGAKGDKTFIRTGENEMRVEAVFSFENDATQIIYILEDMGIEADNCLIISRSLNNSGKSDIRINGRIATISMLKSIGECLVNVFGQNESISLLAEKNHIDILDSVVGPDAKELKTKLNNVLLQIKELNENMSQIGGDKAGRQREIELLQFQIDEIDSVAPKLGEDDEIKEKLRLCSNQERIKESLQTALDCFDGPDGAITRLKTACKSLQNASQHSNMIQELASRCESDLYEIYDISDAIKSKSSDIMLDETEINSLNERNEQLSKLKRKYGITLDEVLKYQSDSNSRLERLLNSEELLKKYQQSKVVLLDGAYKICCDLLNKRRTAGDYLKKAIRTELASLGMKNALLDVEIAEAPQRENVESSMTSKGFDGIRFLFSANAGESLKSLSKTISGGEMSRFMLAFKNVVSEKDSSIMFVFDEVDAGVSGEIGLAVAKRIANIAKTNQVLCITHLPQVCAMADTYLKAEKQTIEGKTYSQTKEIFNADIINQIAHLAGSAFPTEKALEYAKEIKAKSDEYKKTLNA